MIMMRLTGVRITCFPQQTDVKLTLLVAMMMILAISDGRANPIDHDDSQPHPKHIYDDNKQHDKIRRSAAESVGKLGGLWDDISSVALHGSIFKMALPKEFKETIETPHTKYIANYKNSYQEASENYFMGTEQSISMFGNIGIGFSYSDSAFGSDHKSKNTEKYTFSGISRSMYKYFNENDPRLSEYYDYKRLVSNTRASHIIVGVSLGVRYDVSISLGEMAHGNITGSERALTLQLAAKELEAHAELKNSTIRRLQLLTSNFEVVFVGNIASPVFDQGASPWDIIRELPRFLQNAEEAERYIALEFTLLPIESFYKFLSPEILDDIVAQGRTLFSLSPLLESEADAFQDFINTFNERKEQVSLVCDSILSSIGRFVEKGGESPLARQCQKIKTSEQKVRTKLLDILREVRLDDGDNCDRIGYLYNYTDANYVSESEIRARSGVSFQIQRFINAMNKTINSGVIVADGKISIVSNIIARRAKSYTLFYNSSQILYAEQSNDYILDFERNAETLVAIKGVDNNEYQFITMDCFDVNLACPNFGKFKFVDLHITEYRHTSVYIEDLMYYFALRKDYCEKPKFCDFLQYFSMLGNYACKHLPTYPFCFPAHLNFDVTDYLKRGR